MRSVLTRHRVSSPFRSGSPPDGPGRRITLYSDLWLAMIENRAFGRDRQGRLWHVLRWLDVAGRGFIPVDRLRMAARMLKISRRSVRRLMSGGSGVFWMRSPQGLYLRCPAKVAVALGVRAFRA